MSIKQTVVIWANLVIEKLESQPHFLACLNGQERISVYAYQFIKWYWQLVPVSRNISHKSTIVLINV